MKRMLCLLLGFCFLLCSCAAPAPQAEPYVVTTIFPAYDFACQIMGSIGQVDLLIPLGGEAHGYEPTMDDLAAVQACDVFIYNGGESDDFAQQLLNHCDLSQKTVIRMMDHVELLVTGEEEHHHEHEHTHHEADEHIWTTPQNGLRIAKAVAQGLQAQDPDHRAVYQENWQGLQQQLQQLCADYDCLAYTDDTPLLVADRFPFTYLTRQYDLPYYAAFSGCTSNTEASLSAVQQLIETAAHHRISVVLHTEFSDGVLADTVAKGVGARTAMWHSCHNVSREDFENGVTYVRLMTQNLTVLKEALSR